MIVMRSVKKSRNRRVIFDRLSAVFQPRSHYVIFGLPQSGKTTLLGLLCGLQKPSRGTISRFGLVTPPIGHPEMLAASPTVRGAAALYSAIYQVNLDEYIEFIEDFSGFGSDLDKETTALPPHVRLSLAYALGYGLPADFYLFDGAVGFGRGEFAKMCRRAFDSRQRDAATIFATRVTNNAEEYGEIGVILHDGQLTSYASVREAAEVYTMLDLESKRGTLASAELLTTHGRYAEAQEHLIDLIKSNEEDVAAYRLLATVASRAGNFSTALDALLRISELIGDDPDNYSRIIQTASRAENWQIATRYLERVLELRPQDRETKVQLAKLHQRMGNMSVAVSRWRELAAEGMQGPDVTEAIRVAMRAEDWSGAIQIIDQCLRHRPDDATLLELKLQPLLLMGDFAGFKKTIEELAVMDTRKALLLGQRWLPSLTADNIYELLLSLRDKKLLEDSDPKLISRYLAALENLARTQQRSANVAESKRIRLLARAIEQPKND